VARKPGPINVGNPCELIKRRYDALKGSTERSQFEAHAQEIAELISPRKIDFVGMRTAGEKQMHRVYDPTGIHANEMLGAGLHGMATNPATKWFSLRMVGGGEWQDPSGKVWDINEMPEVQKYLADTEQMMWERLYQPGTNFTTALHEFYLDLGAFGNAILFAGQRDDGGLMFEARSLAECVFVENAHGRIDTVYRCSEYTVRQMMQMAESDGWNVSEAVKDKFRAEKYDDKVKVIHCVQPRSERAYNKKNTTNMPFASIYFEHEECHLLEESGFPEFPYLVARFSKYSSEVYGRGPGMTALPDVKMLQAMAVTKIKLLQKAADPPMWIKAGGEIGQTRTIPGGLNYWRGNPHEDVMLQPVSLEGLQAITAEMDMIRQSILRTFYADIMRMTDRADMTATEVVHRTAEQMRLFGPLVGRLESEALGPLVERVFGILSRMGVLPPAPEAIQEREFTVEYVSPIATAQKQQQAHGIMQVMQLIGMFGPDIAAQIASKNLDVNKLFRWLWDLYNNDPDLLTDDDDLETSEQQDQTMRAVQAGVPMADIASKGAGAVKQLADAGQKGGINIPELIARFQQETANNPRAQLEARSLMSGQAPPDMGVPGMGA
jgi:hypothetical protein